MKRRLLLSVLAFVVYGAGAAFFAPAATLASGKLAAEQFANSDAAPMTLGPSLSALSAYWTLTSLALLAALASIWGDVLAAFLRRRSGQLALVLCALAALGGQARRAEAFAETTDRTEAYTILPNESAFWIPDVGANRDNQAQLDSEAFFQERKVALKRFVVPHQKLAGSGGASVFSGWDIYVPTGRLIIVDRTPYSREWVASHERGTSARDESFPCQSREGLNVSVGVSIGASVQETNAAKYLYRFGVIAPKGARNDPQVIFASVFYSRSLAEVMDDVGRKKVQTVVCEEISSRGFDKVNEEATPIMESVRKKTADYFSGVGISLDFLGWADTFTFDASVQKAVNDRYAAEKLKDVLPVLQAINQLKVQEGLGAGLASKGLPVVVTPDMLNALANLTAKASAPASR
jgi:hypothetical protein